jgi:hypothetical protein
VKRNDSSAQAKPFVFFDIMPFFAAIQKRYTIFIDPETKQHWIHDENEEHEWTNSEIAVQLLQSIQEWTSSSAPLPPPQPPCQPLPPPCLHAPSRFNGMAWACQQSLGRELTSLNWISPTESTCQSWKQLLFENTQPSRACPGTGFEAAVMHYRADFEWASMATHGAREFGIAVRCRACQKICRLSWNKSSTPNHMRIQRAHILGWLNLLHELPLSEDPVPIV